MPRLDAPDELAVSTERPLLKLRLVAGRYALHGPPQPDEPAAALSELAGGQVRVYDGDPPAALAPHAGPVYSPGLDGVPAAIPTGRVLVRFTEDTRAGERAADIEEAGFVVDEVLAYAPHAAWVRARSGTIGEALAGVEALEAIPGVVNVEPQLLYEAERKAAEGPAQLPDEP